VRAIDQELAALDEGAMVRALARSSARGEPSDARATILDRLDRLRALEERRATLLHRLLEASSLLRRAVELGLGVRDEQAEHERRVHLALRALDPDDDDESRALMEPDAPPEPDAR
jgi:septal ring factor EnvC (AmiA/AmiB activator)